MEVGRVRRATGSGARAGSVWESRMKLDEVRGGVKVFNGVEDDLGSDPGGSVEDDGRVLRKSPIVGSAKRKTWKSETNFEGFDSVKNSPVQISKLRSDLNQIRRRSSSDSEKTPVQGRRRLRSERIKELDRCGESRKPGSAASGDGVEKNEKILSLSSNFVVVDDEPETHFNGGSEIELDKKEDPVGSLGVCNENVVSSDNVAQEQHEEGGEELEELEEDEFEDMEEDMVVVEKESIDVKEINGSEEQEREPDQKPKKVVNVMAVVVDEKKIGKLNTKPLMAMASTVRTQLPPPSPVIRRSSIHLNHQPTKPSSSPGPSPAHDQFKRFPHTQNKLQSLVDLVMWRDVSRSAFVFGIGTFVIVSSSYTQDLNISFISVISYVGLVYLAAIFLYKSIICRGVMDTYDDASYVVGEGEAVWLLKLFLPYLNESLLKLRALFSGDPSTTMKLAVLLFVLARCGNSITIWKMAKFGFFGVFTLPKVCSSYSTHITAYGRFWVQRSRDAWESCTHKKAVAFAVFTLVWNLSSIVARVWAVFMLMVAMRYYQQSVMARDDWEEDASNAAESEDRREGLRQAQRGGLGRQRQGPNIVESKKTKKGS